MTPYIQVTFEGVPRDPALELAIHRSLARLEARRGDVVRARAKLEPVESRPAATSLTLTVSCRAGTTTAVASHLDPVVAVAESFRTAARALDGIANVVPSHALARARRAHFRAVVAGARRWPATCS